MNDPRRASFRKVAGPAASHHPAPPLQTAPGGHFCDAIASSCPTKEIPDHCTVSVGVVLVAFGSMCLLAFIVDFCVSFLRPCRL
jgi:hypothetical protein